METAKNLILMELSTEQIAQATKLSIEQIENLNRIYKALAKKKIKSI